MEAVSGRVAVPDAGAVRRGPVVAIGAFWLLAIIAVTVVTAVNPADSIVSEIAGTGGFLAALVFCLILCIRAAVRYPASRRAWTLLSVSVLVSTLVQVSYVASTVAGSGPAEATTPGIPEVLGIIAYGVPFVVALFLLPRPKDLAISRFRQILDIAVITIGLLLISGVTVLEPASRALGTSSGGWLIFAYPVNDLVLGSVVLCLGMRQRSGNRMTFFFLGSALLVFAITDSIYLRLLVEGRTGLLSSPLAAGWMATPVLIGIATLIPLRNTNVAGGGMSLPVQLVPYVPVVGAMVVLSFGTVVDSPFLISLAVLLLLLVAVRQIMIVYENVVLTRDLEAKVAARTAELTTLGSIVTSSSDAIVGVSLRNQITTWNPAAERLYGHTAEEMIGTPPLFLPGDSLRSVRSLLEDARSGEQLSSIEVDWERPDGTQVPVAMTVSPIIDDEGVQGISVTAQDITVRRRTNDYLEQARNDALESSRLKSEFLATMSHEIRTPMNGVIGLTSLLLETELDTTQRQYAEGVSGAGEALLSVINDILDFSKLEAGRVVLDPIDFDPHTLVDEVGALLAPAASAKGLELIAYCLPEVPRSVRGDPGRIRQILLNLASNAVKFTPTGEVAVMVEAEAAAEGRCRLHFEITDTGIGIAERDQSRLFQSFSQADASTTRRFGGTGLGLAISRRLVEVMDGEIGLESELGRGSRFWFTLELPIGAEPRPALHPSHDLLDGLRALVVDDNATNRTILEKQLTSWRLQADVAEDADTALELLRSRADEGHPYDLAALDMCMPLVDGLALGRSIQADPVLEGMPLIMLTSSTPPDPGELRDAGIAQYITKPVRSSDLYDRLLRMLAVKETELTSRRRTQRGEAPPEPGSRGPVLVVEDNALNQVVARGMLTRLGYDVDVVGDGREALLALERASYGAVLMDCHMPHVDGFEATAEIRRREPPGVRVPIIAMTAGALPEERERCLAVGMNGYISKPVDVDTLEVKLRELGGPPVGVLPPDQVGPPAGRAIDASRLADLSELASADGSGLLQALVTSFVQRSRNRLNAIRAAAEAGDMVVLEAAAHELKGAAGTIGALEVERLCRELETAVRRDDLPRPGLLDELTEALDVANTELSGLDTGLNSVLSVDV